MKPNKVQVTPKKVVKPSTTQSTTSLRVRKSPRVQAKDIVAGMDTSQTILAIKYNSNLPYVEMHPVDSRRLKVIYISSKLNARIGAEDKSVEIRATSKQSRDLIALLIKCFSAQAHFINAKII